MKPGFRCASVPMFAGVIAFACAPERGAGAKPLVITGDSVAGIPVRAAYATLGKFARFVRDTIEPDVEAIPESIAVLLVRNDTVRAVIDSGRVYRLTVTSARFQTVDSLGVGTPLSRLLRLPNVFALTGEGAVWVQSPSHCGVAFHLSQSGTLAEGPDSVGIRELQTLPHNTIVAEIIAFGCPTEGHNAPHI